MAKQKPPFIPESQGVPTKSDVILAINNALAMSRNYLDFLLTAAQPKGGPKLHTLSQRQLASYTEELIKPLLEHYRENLILKEELVVALVAGAYIVNQLDTKAVKITE